MASGLRPRSRALKPDLIRVFFIRNRVFLLQISPAFIQTIQIPPEFLEGTGPSSGTGNLYDGNHTGNRAPHFE